MAIVHESMQRLCFLVGRWRGIGTGILPHNGTFQFEEELHIESIGQPNFAYAATAYIDGKPKHRESGFLKCHENGQLVFCLADNLGTCTVLLGTVGSQPTDDTKLVLTSDSISRGPGNKEPHVIQIQREYFKDGEHLHLRVKMATSRVEDLSDHLEVVYHRETE